MMKVVVLISGSGSNLQAILDHIAHHHLPVVVQAVISNVPHALGLERATQAGIPALVCDHTAYKKRAEFEAALLNLITPYQPDFLVLAGFLRILSPEFVDHYTNRMVNIHPSLLPAYPGLHTHARALEAQEKEHGTTIHFVNGLLDDGPIIAQAKLQIHPEDTEDSLQKRVLKLEHELYPLVLRWLATKEITYDSTTGFVFCRGKPLPPTGLLVPISSNDED